MIINIMVIIAGQHQTNFTSTVHSVMFLLLHPLSRWVVGYIIKMWRPKTDDVMASAVV